MLFFYTKVTTNQEQSVRYRSESLARHWSQNQSGHCLSETCKGEIEDTKHILLHCRSYNESKKHLYTLWLNKRSPAVYELVLEAFSSTDDYLLQFLLDCSCLPQVILAVQKHGVTILEELFYLTRTWCFTIHRQRMRMLGRWNYQWVKPQWNPQLWFPLPHIYRGFPLVISKPVHLKNHDWLLCYK